MGDPRYNHLGDLPKGKFMDQYLLFAGDKFYPNGGWQDFKASFTTIKAALREATAWGADWWQIVDLKTGEIVEESASGVHEKGGLGKGKKSGY